MLRLLFPRSSKKYARSRFGRELSDFCEWLQQQAIPKPIFAGTCVGFSRYSVEPASSRPMTLDRVPCFIVFSGAIVRACDCRKIFAVQSTLTVVSCEVRSGCERTYIR